MLKSADQGTYSASLVDLSAGGLCLNTDAGYLFGTTVRAYFPDHHGPALKARVIRTWPGGLALKLVKPGSRRLRRFAARLLNQPRTGTHQTVSEPERRRDRAASGLLLMIMGFAAGLVMLTWLGTALAAGLAALTVMMTALAGGYLMDRQSLNQGAVRRAIVLSLTVFFIASLSTGQAGSELLGGGYASLWITAPTMCGLYMASRLLENHLKSRAARDRTEP
jgi:cation transport ATPase